MTIYLVIGEHGSYSGYLNYIVYATANKEEAHSEADSRMKALEDYREQHLKWARAVLEINKRRMQENGFMEPRDFYNSFAGKPYKEYEKASEKFQEESKAEALANGAKKPSDDAPECLRLPDYDCYDDVFHNFFVQEMDLDKACHVELWSENEYPTYFLDELHGDDHRWYTV